jgi:hypothetical protein
MSRDPYDGRRSDSGRMRHASSHAPPQTAEISSERSVLELRSELDLALRRLEARTAEARAASDEAERATLHALRMEVELAGLRRLLSRLKERIIGLHDRSGATHFEAELLDLRTILEIHAPPSDDDER